MEPFCEHEKLSMDENKLFQICLGKVVTSRRNHLGMSQTLLARVSSVDRAHVHDIELGRCNPGMQSLSQISDALGWRFSFFISKVEKLFESEINSLSTSGGDCQEEADLVF